MKIGILGYGNMGQALCRSLRQLQYQGRFSFELFINDKKPFPELEFVTVDQLLEVDILFICVKPQDFPKVAKEFKGALVPCLVSLMAGVKIPYLQPFGKTLIRAMPNVGIGVQKGVTGLYFSQTVSKEMRDFVQTLFSYMGFCIEVTEEEKLDKITALSGSGPAYFLKLADYLIEKSKQLGFSDKESQRLVLYTLMGTARGVERLGFLPQEMIKKIASKGGTTAAALEYLNTQGYDTLIEGAIDAAIQKAKDLSLPLG